MKILQLIETAYRGTIEEQDDPVIWLTRAMINAGARLDVLLSGNAVNYAVRAQNAQGLSIGAVAQTQPPQLADDLRALIAQGATVHLIAEDLEARGIARGELIDGIVKVGASGVAALFGAYEKIWRW